MTRSRKCHEKARSATDGAQCDMTNSLRECKVCLTRIAISDTVSQFEHLASVSSENCNASSEDRSTESMGKRNSITNKGKGEICKVKRRIKLMPKKVQTNVRRKKMAVRFSFSTKEKKDNLQEEKEGKGRLEKADSANRCEKEEIHRQSGHVDEIGASGNSNSEKKEIEGLIVDDHRLGNGSNIDRVICDSKIDKGDVENAGNDARFENEEDSAEDACTSESRNDIRKTEADHPSENEEERESAEDADIKKTEADNPSQNVEERENTEDASTTESRNDIKTTETDLKSENEDDCCIIGVSDRSKLRPRKRKLAKSSAKTSPTKLRKCGVLLSRCDHSLTKLTLGEGDATNLKLESEENVTFKIVIDHSMMENDEVLVKNENKMERNSKVVKAGKPEESMEKPTKTISTFVYSSGDFSGICEVCGKKQSSRKNYNKHLARFHSDIAPYTCMMCSKNAFSFRGLATHSLMCHRKNISACLGCRHCDEQFKSQDELEKHLRSTHGFQLPISCRICYKLFKKAESLFEHLKEHSEQSSDYKKSNTLVIADIDEHSGHSLLVTSDSIVWVNPDLGILLNELQSELSDQSSVSNMSSINKARKPNSQSSKRICIKCEICSVKFKTEEKLFSHHMQRHFETFQGHQCKVCGDTFLSNDRLKDHNLVHEWAKPLECCFCGCVKSREVELLSHIEEVHKESNDGLHLSIAIESETSSPCKVVPSPISDALEAVGTEEFNGIVVSKMPTLANLAVEVLRKTIPLSLAMGSMIRTDSPETDRMEVEADERRLSLCGAHSPSPQPSNNSVTLPPVDECDNRCSNEVVVTEIQLENWEIADSNSDNERTDHTVTTSTADSHNGMNDNDNQIDNAPHHSSEAQIQSRTSQDSVHQDHCEFPQEISDQDIDDSTCESENRIDGVGAESHIKTSEVYLSHSESPHKIGNKDISDSVPENENRTDSVGAESHIKTSEVHMSHCESPHEIGNKDLDESVHESGKRTAGEYLEKRIEASQDAVHIGHSDSHQEVSDKDLDENVHESGKRTAGESGEKCDERSIDESLCKTSQGCGDSNDILEGNKGSHTLTNQSFCGSFDQSSNYDRMSDSIPQVDRGNEVLTRQPFSDSHCLFQSVDRVIARNPACLSEIVEIPEQSHRSFSQCQVDVINKHSMENDRISHINPIPSVDTMFQLSESHNPLDPMLSADCNLPSSKESPPFLTLTPLQTPTPGFPQSAATAFATSSNYSNFSDSNRSAFHPVLPSMFSVNNSSAYQAHSSHLNSSAPYNENSCSSTYFDGLSSIHRR